MQAGPKPAVPYAKVTLTTLIITICRHPGYVEPGPEPGRKRNALCLCGPSLPARCTVSLWLLFCHVAALHPRGPWLGICLYQHLGGMLIIANITTIATIMYMPWPSCRYITTMILSVTIHVCPSALLIQQMPLITTTTTTAGQDLLLTAVSALSGLSAVPMQLCTVPLFCHFTTDPRNGHGLMRSSPLHGLLAM